MVRSVRFAMVRRVLLPVLGLALLGPIVYLGVRSAHDVGFIAPFGIASAILGPLGIYLVGEGLRGSEKRTLRELSAVPDIAKLISESKDAEERLRLLEDERLRVEEVVRLEARRLSLSERQTLLSADAERILQEFGLIDDEAASLQVSLNASSVLPEVRALHERLAARRRGDYILRIGSKQYAVDRELFAGFSLMWPIGPMFPALIDFARVVRRRAR
jgi:hypothetical protein